MTDLTTIKHIAERKDEIKPFEMKEGTVLKRRVVGVYGSVVMVKSGDYPGEFVGNYTAFLPSSNLGEIWEKQVLKGKPVEAKIQFTRQQDKTLRWEVLELKDIESCEGLATDLEDQKREYEEMGGNY